MATGQITILDFFDLPSMQGYLATTQNPVQALDSSGTVYTPSWASSPNTVSVELYQIGMADNIITDSRVKSIRWYKNNVELTSSITGLTLNTNATSGKNTSITISSNSFMNSSSPSMKITCEVDYSPSPAYDTTPQTMKMDINFQLSIQGAAGYNAYTVILTNESHVISCDANGTALGGEIGTGGRAYSDILVFKGTTALTAVAESATPTTGQFKYVIGTVTGCTATRTDNDTFRVETLTADLGAIPITVYLESGATSVSKSFTWTKSKAATNGTSAKFISIIGPQVFTLAANGSSSSPSTITLTSLKQNATGSVTWAYSGDGGSTFTTIAASGNGMTLGTDGSGNSTLALTWNGAVWGSFKSITFRATADSVFDTFTIYKVKDGIDGQTAVVYYIDVSAPVISKDAPDAATAGTYTSLTATGKQSTGSVVSTTGYITITANGDTESATATANTLTVSPASSAGKSSYVVKMYDTAAKTTLLDSTTIPVVFKGLTGLGAVTAVLTNDAHVISVSEDGNTTNYSGSGTTIYLYEGSNQLTCDGSGSNNGTWNVTGAFTTGSGTVPTITKSGYTATVPNFTSITTDKAVVTYTITGKRANGDAISLTKTQTFSKAKSGTNARTITISGSNVFTTNYAGTTSPASVTLTCALQNITSGTVAWTYGGDGASPTNSITNTAGQTVISGTYGEILQLYPTAAIWGSFKTLTLQAVLGTAKDIVTVYKIADGSNALTLVMSNNNHSIYVDENDTPNYTGSGTTIYVYEGSSLVNYDGVGTSAGTWKITPSYDSSKLTLGTIQDSGAYATVGDHSGMSVDSITVTYNISGTRFNGTSFTLTGIQTLTKSKDGKSTILISVYSNGSTVFRNSNANDAILLTCDLYKGGTVLSTGVTYAWGKQNGAAYDSVGSNKTYTVTASEVDSLEVYRCQATYSNKSYYSTISIVDYTDPYQVEVLSSNGNMFKNSLGNTVLTAVVRRNGSLVSTDEMLYLWSQFDKDGNPVKILNVPSTALSGITLTQTSAGSSATITGSNASFVPNENYVFGSNVATVAYKVTNISGTSVSFDSPSTAPIGSSKSIYKVLSTNILNVSADDVNEKSTYLVDTTKKNP